MTTPKARSAALNAGLDVENMTVFLEVARATSGESGRPAGSRPRSVNMDPKVARILGETLIGLADRLEELEDNARGRPASTEGG